MIYPTEEMKKDLTDPTITTDEYFAQLRAAKKFDTDKSVEPKDNMKYNSRDYALIKKTICFYNRNSTKIYGYKLILKYEGLIRVLPNEVIKYDSDNDEYYIIGDTKTKAVNQINSLIWDPRYIIDNHKKNQ